MDLGLLGSDAMSVGFNEPALLVTQKKREPRHYLFECGNVVE